VVQPQTTLAAMARMGCTEKKSWTMWSKKLYFHIHCPTICTKEVQKEVQKGEAIKGKAKVGAAMAGLAGMAATTIL
jgi:hypothetical protein